MTRDQAVLRSALAANAELVWSSAASPVRVNPGCRAMEQFFAASHSGYREVVAAVW